MLLSLAVSNIKLWSERLNLESYVTLFKIRFNECLILALSYWNVSPGHTYNIPCTFAKEKKRFYHINEVTFLCGCYFKGSLKSIYTVNFT